MYVAYSIFASYRLPYLFLFAIVIRENEACVMYKIIIDITSLYSRQIYNEEECGSL
jgi:hypothetical protein